MLGLGGVCLVLPLGIAFFRDQRASAVERNVEPAQYSLTEVLRTGRFWLLAIAMFLLALMSIALSVHLQPVFSDAGLTARQAAELAALMGPAVILIRAGVGFVLDRTKSSLPAALILSAPILSIILLLQYQGSPTEGVIIVICLALAYGAEVDVCAYLVTRYFGIRAYSAVMGTLYGVLALGGGMGPAVLGMAYDATGSYSFGMTVLLAFNIVAALMILSLGKYPARPD